MKSFLIRFPKVSPNTQQPQIKKSMPETCTFVYYNVAIFFKLAIFRKPQITKQMLYRYYITVSTLFHLYKILEMNIMGEDRLFILNSNANLYNF